MPDEIRQYIDNIRRHRGWLLAGVATVVIAIVVGTLIVLLRGEHP